MFTESFVDNHNAWSVPQSDNASGTINNGAYTLEIKNKWNAWELPNLTFSENVDVQADFTLLSGDPGGRWGFGIGVRSDSRNSNGNFYLLTLEGVGKYYFDTHIFKSTDANNYNIVKTNRIDTQFDPRKSNTIRLVANNDQFTYYLNGVQIGQATDSSLANNGLPKYVLLFGNNAVDGVPLRFQVRNFRVKPLVAANIVPTGHTN